MISVILYGRNDSYGYNLHKRAALSFNSIAELLDDPDDEILFVDYNTPNDYPTFPEAIRDTLTANAHRRLRILRVRPSQHRPFAALSHLVALEPVARNVALRRANPANRWVLSTNTDMIFVPRTGQSLSSIVSILPDGYYHLPRFEIPETLWETLDRSDAPGTIATLGRWGSQFHLNEITDHAVTCLKYDAPGDFQLMLREDGHRIWGFDERMLVGYHVDSNIAARLFQLYGVCGDVLDDLFGYHCDHTRQITPAHKHGSVENDAQKFVFDIDSAFDAVGQAESWGLANEVIEEVRLDGGRVTYLDALIQTITTPMDQPSRMELGPSSVEKTDYDPGHVLPFLLDALVEYPRSTVLGWFGMRADMLALFAEAWAALGFKEAILVSDAATWLGPDLPNGAKWSNPSTLVEDAHAFVLDGGLRAEGDPTVPHPHTPEMRHIIAALRAIASREQFWMAHRKAGVTPLPPHVQSPRRVIAVNGFNNTWELVVRDLIGAAKSPGSTRVRQGFVLPAVHREIDVLPLLSVGAAGFAEPGGIRLALGRRGYVTVGPYLFLLPGRYRIEFGYVPGPFPLAGPVKLEVARDSLRLAVRLFPVIGFAPQKLSLTFEITGREVFSESSNKIEFRLITVGLIAGRINSARLYALPDGG